MTLREADERSTYSLDPGMFRLAMGSFATGVTVVTAAAPDGTRTGCTVNAFCAVSETPALALICVGQQRSICDVLARAPGYAVNILSSEQYITAKAFAESGSCGLEITATHPGRHYIPLLTDALAHIECDIDRIVDAGDHLVVIGRVMSLTVGSGSPLLYYRGQLSAGLP